MEYKRCNNVIILRIDKDEEILTSIKEVALKENIKLANINALGAIKEVEIGAYIVKDKEYIKNKYLGEFEITSLTGSINSMNEEYYSHLHISFAGSDNKVIGGHLTKAVVSATCEMFIYIINDKVDRIKDEEIGINIFKF